MRYIVHRRQRQQVIRVSACGMCWVEEPKRKRRPKTHTVSYGQVCDKCGTPPVRSIT